LSPSQTLHFLISLFGYLSNFLKPFHTYIFESSTAMAATAAYLFPPAPFSGYPTSLVGKLNSYRTSIITTRLATSGECAPAATAEVKRPEEKKEKDERCMNGWKEYLVQSKELIVPDGGPPRWFSPLECAWRLDNSPLLFFLPG